MTQHDNIGILPPPERIDLLSIPGFIGFHIDLEDNKWLELTSGTWRIVGRAKELTEEQIIDLFGKHEYGKNSLTKKVAPTGFITDDSRYTLISFLRSHGIDLETNPLILIKTDKA